MRLENGDAFEVENAAWLREKLPHYESVWSAFIGNDGTGSACGMSALDERTQDNRRRFYQAHYSMARSMWKITQLNEEFQGDLAHVRSYQEFEAMTDKLFYHVAYVGHVRDMFKIIDDELGLGESLFGPLGEFYAKRNHVIHGPRLPVLFRDGLLMIPSIAARDEKMGQWTSKATWEEVEPKDFQFAADFVANTTQDLFNLVNKLHGKIYGAANARFGGNRITEGFERMMPAPVSGTLSGRWTSTLIRPSGEFLQ